jgi:hypothetical protein
MYNYLLLSSKKINYINLLLKIKRLLPKHLNCIPDKTAISIFNTIKKTNSKFHMLETGCGVSTIAMFLAAIHNKKKFYTFEQSQEKISIIKQIINETISEPLKLNISDYWTPIPTNSLCHYTGINSLTELKNKFDFAFFDSAHTREHLINEVDLYNKLAPNIFYIGLDDGHMNYKYVNIDYINLIRKKVGLKNIILKDNKCKKLYLELKQKLLIDFKNVKMIDMLNKKKLQKDAYFDYYKDLVYKPNENIKEYITCFFRVKKN